MSTAQILLLGGVAGATIFLGLPVARMQGLGPNARAGLSSLATGILVFLFWDVMTNAVDPIDSSLHAHAWGKFAERRTLDLTNPAVRLAFLIAIGIGVHNFAEGLAIGQAAAASEIALAVTLIIGFGLHNATEGFGICGPLSGAGIVPSWRLLGLLGLIGGAPTFLGTVVGQAWASDAVSVVFFTVAGGSILYVVRELFAVNRKYGHPVLVTWLLVAGILLGFATDFVVTAAGV